MTGKKIEIVGFPAVGKTTLMTRALCKDSLNHLVIISSKKNSFFQKILAKFYLAIWLIWTMPSPQISRKIAYRLSLRPFMGTKKNYIFFDSGLVQLIVETIIEQPEYKRDAMLGLIKYFRPDVLIFVEDKIDNIVARELSRPDRRYPALSGKELEIRYKRAEEFLKYEVFPLIRKVYTVNIQDENEFLEKIRA